MKTGINTANKRARWTIYAILGCLLFFGAAHHVINFWELPVLWMFLLFVLGTPALAVLSAFLGRRLAPHIEQIPKKRLFLLALAALLVGSFVAWRTHRVPEAFHTVTIRPDLSASGQVGLLELKGNFQVISLQKAALESGWREENDAYYASPDSRPLLLSFRSPVNKPVTALFLTSPEGGAVEVSLNFQSAQVELSNPLSGQSTLRFVSDYRSIPGWIFVSILTLSDIFTFGLLILVLLVLQEVGDTSAVLRNLSPGVKFFSPRVGLAVLLAFGVLLHTANMLAVPLTLGPDSPAFLQGALHLLEHGNFEGVSQSVGPGSTFLFAPVLWLFGRNAWGLKILLHLIALASIPVAYRLGWQLSKNYLVAFLSGLVVALSPDMFFYSNNLMSDVPNLFLVLLCCSLLFSTLERPTLVGILATLLVGSFATLLRSENILLPVIAALALAASRLWQWLQKSPVDLKRAFLQIGLSVMIASLPILWWSNHNLNTHGFWGMSNYMGVVLYDGWVYFGDASGLPFSKPDSLAVQKIEQAVDEHPIIITDRKGFATGWEIYPALLKSGYTTDQAMDLLKTAALDSIRNNPGLSLRLLFIKLETGLKLGVARSLTYPLPGEPGWGSNQASKYFEADNLGIPLFVRWQRMTDEQAGLWYPHLYPLWTLFCVLALVLSSLRQPVLHWAALAAIVASRIFVPLTMSVPFWRYTLSGWFPLQVIALSCALVLIGGLITILKTGKAAPLR